MNVVLFRGTVPCDLLFVGEGPGESEDIAGVPFIGASGDLLTSLIEDCCKTARKHPKIAYANIVGCIPWSKDSEGNTNGVRPPKAKEAEVCGPRLERFINRIAKPQRIVTLGQTAAKFIRFADPDKTIPLTSLIHPAAILYMLEGQQGLALKRFKIGLKGVLSDL